MKNGIWTILLLLASFASFGQTEHSIYEQDKKTVLEYFRAETNGGKLDFEAKMKDDEASFYMVENTLYNRKDYGILLWAAAIKKTQKFAKKEAVKLWEEIKQRRLTKAEKGAFSKGFVLIPQVKPAQNEEKKTTDFDYEIYEYLMQYVETTGTKKSSYLKFTKPLSKWDARPVDVSEARIMGETQPSSIIANFFWGSFSNYYGVTQEDAMALPNTFLSSAKFEERTASEFAKEHQSELSELIKGIQVSAHKVFLSQEGLKRIDAVYLENGDYWRYSIPEKSPFPMSSNLEPVINYEYSKTALKILEQMSSLKIYAVFEREGIIYLLLDGLLDNSYGYIFHSGEIVEASNHLFEIMYSTEVFDNLYYYVAN